MATFTVQNLSGTRLGVPPPVARVLDPGATAEVEAQSLDTDAIAALINDGSIGVVPAAAGSAGEAAVEAASKANASSPTSMLGTIDAPIVLAGGETATLTHNLGVKASAIDVYDSDGANFTSAADITVTQANANTLAVQSTAGGSFVIVAKFARIAGATAAEVPQNHSLAVIRRTARPASALTSSTPNSAAAGSTSFLAMTSS